MHIELLRIDAVSKSKKKNGVDLNNKISEDRALAA